MHEYNINSINALDWLDKNPKTANLLVTARELLALQELIQQLVPGNLAKRIVVAQVDGQQITLIVPGPAYASKLKQINNTLIKQLNLNGWSVNKIIIQIDAHMSTRETKPAQREANFLDQESLKSFAELERQVSPGPLAQAIRKLLEHHTQNS